MAWSTFYRPHFFTTAGRPGIDRPRRLTLMSFVPLLLSAWCIFAAALPAQGQNVQHTGKSQDLGLRGDARVNPATFGLELEIPLGSYPGRAGNSVPVSLYYSSKVWRVEFSGYNPGITSGGQYGPGQPVNPYSIVEAKYAEYSRAGWTSSIGMPSVDPKVGNESYTSTGQPVSTCDPPGSCWSVGRLLVRMPDGSAHEVRAQDDPKNCTYVTDCWPADYYAVDGSRLHYHKPSQTLYMPDGSYYLLALGQYVDRNGNTMTAAAGGGWTDTLGRTIPAPPMSQTPGTFYYDLPGVGGAKVRYAFVWKYLGEAGVMGTPGGLRYVSDRGVGPQSPAYGPYLFNAVAGSTQATYFGNGAQLFNPVVLQQIVLPTGQAYTFTYNAFGEVERVVYPTGAYERYLHGAGAAVTPAAAPYGQAIRGVVDRYVNVSGEGTEEAKWEYRGGQGPSDTVVTEVAAPDGTLTQSYRYRDPGVYSPFGYSLDEARSAMPYEERVYSPPDVAGNRRLLRRRLTKWEYTGRSGVDNGSLQATRNARTTKEVLILFDTDGDALTKTTEYGYDLNNQFTTGINQTSVSEYDYATISKSAAETTGIDSVPRPAQPLRTTETSYLDSANEAYRLRNILGLPTSVKVRDGAGNVVAKTATAYDEPAYQLGNTYGALPTWAAPPPTRGNATTTRHYLAPNATADFNQPCPAVVCLETHTQYDQAGSAVSTTDARGSQTLIDYSSAYAYAYPTSVTTAAPNTDSVSDSGITFGPGAFGSTTGLTSFTDYDPDTGLVTTATDANGRQTRYDYTDPLNRLKRVERPDGGTTTYEYGRYNNAGRVSDYVCTATLLDTGRSVTSYQYFDGLGRPDRSFLYEGGSPAQFLTTDTQYDASGRVWRVSNPYRSTGSDEQIPQPGVWTTTGYDALGRATKVTTPDGAQVTTVYDGNQVTVTDQAGRKRSSASDALGRLSQVTEDPTGGGFNYLTSYTYDALGNLRRVYQGGQQRFFMYDALGRLTRARNPEQAANGSITGSDPITDNSQWSTAYAYDANGNLLSKTDARGVTANYKYDRLNRNIITSYASDPEQTPAVYRHYDNPEAGKNGLGRFWWSSTRDSATGVGGYDNAGRVREQHQNFLAGGAWSADFSVKLEYNVAGGITRQTYPSGHVVTYNYDAAGRVGDSGAQAAFSGNLGDGVARTYASSVTYSESGGLRQERFGTQTPLYNKRHYNVRGQFMDVRLSTAGWDADRYNWDRGLIANYYSTAELSAATNAGRAQSGADNNGNLLRSGVYVPLDQNAAYTDTAAGAYAHFQDRYSYDALNRLKSVTEFSQTPAQGFGQRFAQVYNYDRWGNRTIDAAATQVYDQNQDYTVPEPQFELSPQTNQEVPEPSNRLYAPGDANRAPSQKLMRYDAAGNLVHDAHTGTGGRSYDAENRMVSAYDSSGNVATYTYDADGRRVRRQVAGEEWWQVYGAGGELLAEYRAGAATYVPTKEYGYRGGELLVTMSSGDDLRLRRFVQNLYYGALRRDPTAQEWEEKTNQLAAAGAQGQAQLLAKAKDVARSLFTQTGYETSPYRADGQYVTDLYYTYLQRAPETQGLNWWTAQAAGGAGNRSNVCNAFEASSEFSAVVSTLYGGAASDDERTDRFIHLFYLGAYSRIATAAELQEKRGQLNAAAAQGPEALKVAAEAMGRSLFAPQVTDLSLPAEQYVTNLYEGFLQRGPDAGGLSFWTAQAGTTAQSRQTVLNAFAACDPFKELAGALYRETFWLVSDHLGTPRMVVDRTGSLAGVKRHDYLPFGEEIGAGSGGRALAQGYGSSNTVRQRFAGKERDFETGLDYLGARYYGSNQGRFISPDPLLSSAVSKNPQTWNRYSYALNIPTRLVDPLGLFVFDKNVDAAARDKIRVALTQAWVNLIKISATYGYNSKEYTSAKRALTAYGVEGQKNGVTIFVKKGTGYSGGTEVEGVAHTKTQQNPNGQNIHVTFDEDAVNHKALSDVIAHEGSHAADGSDWVTSGFKLNANPLAYKSEFDGYIVGSILAEARDPHHSTWAVLPYYKPPGKNPYLADNIELYNSGWAGADRATLSAFKANIDRILARPAAGGGYGLTPTSPDRAFTKGARF